jgi:quercetin dioxygenase-like cupin family protein
MSTFLHASAPLPADDPARNATIVHAEDSSLIHLGIGTGTYTILISGQDTDGRYALIDMLVPAGGGPPPHRHDFEEMFHVLEGELEISFRGAPHRLAPGQTINIPANAPHSFRVISGGPARFLCLCLPAGQEEFFALVGEPLPTRTTLPLPLSPQSAAERRQLVNSLAGRFRTELLPPAG